MRYVGKLWVLQIIQIMAAKEPVDVFFTDWDLYSEMLV
jgi:hypothetical protein